MAQWWEQSPPTNVAQVRILDLGSVICGLSFVIDSHPCPEGFLLGTPNRFSSLFKLQHSFLNSNLIDPETVDKEPLCVQISTEIPIYLYLFYFPILLHQTSSFNPCVKFFAKQFFLVLLPLRQSWTTSLTKCFQGVTNNGLASHSDGVAILLVTSCHRKMELSTDCTYTCTVLLHL